MSRLRAPWSLIPGKPDSQGDTTQRPSAYIDRIISPTLKPAILTWTMHVIIVSICFLSKLNEARDLVLVVAWIISAALCLSFSKGWRGRALLLMCFSVVLAQRALANLILGVSCIFGRECM